MFFLLIWLPIGALVSGVIMFILRNEFRVYDEDDFFNNIGIFVAMAILWPLAIIYFGLLGIYHLIYER